MRCLRCLLVQFRTNSGYCRKCTQPLPPPPRFEVVAGGGLSPLRPRAARATGFGADPDFLGGDPQPRGKTARELTIGRRLRELREQRHLTQQEMACKAGVPRTYISRIENARLLPGPVMLRRIADALAVTILDLLPPSKNGSPGADSEQEAFWSSLVPYFSQLQPHEMSLVVGQVRAMVEEGKTESFAPALVASHP